MSQELSTGYLISTIIDDYNGETLYAELPEGTIICCKREYSTSFYRKEDEWKECIGIPEEAKFCGHYVVPIWLQIIPIK